MKRWNNNPKYGPQHREAREKKLASLSVPACEVTGGKKDLQAHHQVPKCLGGPDLAENYTILQAVFHDMLHTACNVRDPALIEERKKTQYAILNTLLEPEKLQEHKQHLDTIDAKLVPEYVQNFIERIAFHYQHILKLTLVSNFKTISSQNIEIERLKAIIKHNSIEI